MNKKLPIIRIDDDIPLPTTSARIKYPFSELQRPGQSFFYPVPAGGDSPARMVARIRDSFWHWRKRWGGPHEQITIRQVPGGVRVWRVR